MHRDEYFITATKVKVVPYSLQMADNGVFNFDIRSNYGPIHSQYTEITKSTG